MPYKLSTSLLSLVLFSVAFSTGSLEIALTSALLAFLSALLFWGRIFTELADRMERGTK